MATPKILQEIITVLYIVVTPPLMAQEDQSLAYWALDMASLYLGPGSSEELMGQSIKQHL